MEKPKLLPHHRILLTGLYPAEREKLAALVAGLGGEVCAFISRNDLPHTVITRNVRSAKYRAVLRLDAAIPVLLPEWLHDSAAAGRLVPHSGYRVGPFLGLTICFSGLSAQRKSTLSAQVEQLGGMHSPPLDKRCTHLVTNSTDSEKYRSAAWLGGGLWICLVVLSLCLCRPVIGWLVAG